MDKLCPRCNELKDISEFYPLKRGGYSCWCKECGKKYTLWYYRKRRQADPDFGGVLRSYERNRTCKILREHHERFSSDPEHLTTEFLQKVIGIKCDL